MRAWIEIGESVFRAGVRKLVIVNAHGGNMALMDVVARELRVRHGMFVAHTSWHMFGYPEGLYSADEMRLGIHAGEVETSLMLYYRPDTVMMDKAEDFRPVTYEMDTTFRQLRTGRPMGFGWMAQDIHQAGAMGNAAGATVAKGEITADFGAKAFVEALADVHRFDLSRLKKGPLAGVSTSTDQS
jgi:creatinine amidohydrolase